MQCCACWIGNPTRAGLDIVREKYSLTALLEDRMPCSRVDDRTRYPIMCAAAAIAFQISDESGDTKKAARFSASDFSRLLPHWRLMLRITVDILFGFGRPRRRNYGIEHTTPRHPSMRPSTPYRTRTGTSTSLSVVRVRVRYESAYEYRAQYDLNCEQQPSSAARR